jgi:hypothetical protein
MSFLEVFLVLLSKLGDGSVEELVLLELMAVVEVELVEVVVEVLLGLVRLGGDEGLQLGELGEQLWV